MTRGDIIRMAQEAGIHAAMSPDLNPSSVLSLLRFAGLVAAAEREACARLCDDEWAAWANPDWQAACRDLASAIRARGAA